MSHTTEEQQFEEYVASLGQAAKKQLNSSVFFLQARKTNGF